MNAPSEIRLLAANSNERGDLFTRLVRDLFFALGYDDLRCDIHKSGREIDIQGRHRFENRLFVAECKAHSTKMGGDKINKFLGILTREQDRNAPVQVAAYFLSLSGFTETAIEQETEMRSNRIILLDAKKVVDELERCRAIVTSLVAVERAGQCIQNSGVRGVLFDGVELLGHKRGYIWAVYYACGKQRTHFALVHADGTALAEGIATEVVDADRLYGGVIHSLRYLPPPLPTLAFARLAAAALERYQRWLAEECGYIQLDGLPADTDLSSTRLKLERLFVPLKATLLPGDLERTDGQNAAMSTVANPTSQRVIGGKTNTSGVQSAALVGEIFKLSKHLAVLAAPGGGKSTLLKRLATAYAFPERRLQVLDSLPSKDWLPLILRCRELRDRAHYPMMDLINEIPRHAGMSSEEGSAFHDAMHAALRSGQALLLVDGLDEISDPGARQAFANHLRTFIAMFPEAGLIITSREAGFRLVAGVIVSACTLVKLLPLDRDDVLHLCELWYVEVMGDSEKVRHEAIQLAYIIWKNSRIRTLAQNPLLLITLLVVKRYIGELPRNRAMLYREVVRVLLRTWNVEGYAPLDEDEALAQLSYVACSMIEGGSQQIGQRALLSLLQSARGELEAELQFARISPHQFVERIEYRSSILMQSGHQMVDGFLEPVYEFRHLTFQEYLAARGYVEAQHPGRDPKRDLAQILDPYFASEPWLEVVSLAAVLAGSKAEELVKRLSRACERPIRQRKGAYALHFLRLQLLYKCIQDEVKVTSGTLQAGLRILASKLPSPVGREWINELLSGRFSDLFKQIMEENYFGGGRNFEQYVDAAAAMSYELFCQQQKGEKVPVENFLLNELMSAHRVTRIRAAFVIMFLAYWSGSSVPKYDDNLPSDKASDFLKKLPSLAPRLYDMLDPSDWPSTIAASWALAWLYERKIVQVAPSLDNFLSLYRVWLDAEDNKRSYFTSWALGVQPLLARSAFDESILGDRDLLLRRRVEGTSSRRVRTGPSVFAALIVGWYRRAPWSDTELANFLSKRDVAPIPTSCQRMFLLKLGEAGRKVLDRQDRKSFRRTSRSSA